LALFDSNVNQAKLHGANRDYILNHIPHISSLMSSSMQEVIDSSEVVVIGNKAVEFSNVLHCLRNDQVLIDFVRIKDKKPHNKQYQGICW